MVQQPQGLIRWPPGKIEYFASKKQSSQNCYHFLVSFLFPRNHLSVSFYCFTCPFYYYFKYLHHLVYCLQAATHLNVLLIISGNDVIKKQPSNDVVQKTWSKVHHNDHKILDGYPWNGGRDLRHGWWVLVMISVKVGPRSWFQRARILSVDSCSSDARSSFHFSVQWILPANCLTVKPKRTTFQWGDRDVYYQSALHVYLVIRLKFPVHSFPVTTIFQHPWHHLTIQKSKYRITITSLDSLQKLQLTRTTQSGTIFHGYVNHWNDKRETALLWSRI